MITAYNNDEATFIKACGRTFLVGAVSNTDNYPLLCEVSGLPDDAQEIRLTKYEMEDKFKISLDRLKTMGLL